MPTPVKQGICEIAERVFSPQRKRRLTNRQERVLWREFQFAESQFLREKTVGHAACPNPVSGVGEGKGGEHP